MHWEEHLPLQDTNMVEDAGLLETTSVEDAELLETTSVEGAELLETNPSPQRQDAVAIPQRPRTAPHHADAMREVRAMIVAALPCPPLPVMASREAQGECSFTEEACCSSHDLIAHLMNIACTHATEAQNRHRARLQVRLHADLFDTVDEWGKRSRESSLLPPAEWSYTLLCDFTRKYIRCYMPDPSRQQDIRFLPLCDIDRTHPVHVKALEFQKGQDTLYGNVGTHLISRSYDVMSYAELVQVSVARILESSGQELCEGFNE
jgi:hypothetical protein